MDLTIRNTQAKDFIHSSTSGQLDLERSKAIVVKLAWADRPPTDDRQAGTCGIP
jgi:hypothetical protein